MKTFTFYEFAGIIAPGALALMGIAFLFPSTREVLIVKDLSIGGMGLFSVISYVAGHLIQALGNVMEWLWWWTCGGMPTDWIRTMKGGLLSNAQIDSLMKRVAVLIDSKNGFKLEEISSNDWQAITRQVHAVVVARGNTERLEAFNGNYGLTRGIAAALVIIAVSILLQDVSHWKMALIVFVGAVIALFRMHRFAKHYARELFIQFLSRDSV